jgi:hypothetical protein
MSIAAYNITNLLSTTEARIVPSDQDRALMTSKSRQAERPNDLPPSELKNQASLNEEERGG